MIHTIFPILENVNEQAQNREYGEENYGYIYCINDRLLPFQFSIATSKTVTNVYLMNNKTGAQVVDLYSYIAGGDWVYEDFTDTSNRYVLHLGDSQFSGGYVMPDGEYYLEIHTNETGTPKYYSEVFRVMGGDKTTIPTKYFKLEFSNSKDIDDDEPICYQDSFAQRGYFKVDAKAPKHRMIEDVIEFEGIEVTRTVTVQEIHVVRMMIPETIYRGLIRLPLHDTVTVLDRYGNDNTTAKNITIGAAEWKGGGHFCSVDIEYVTESGTMKNTNINLT